MWVVTDTGVGPVRIGMTAAELATALRMDAPVPASGCEYVRPADTPARGPDGVLVMVVDGVSRRVDVIAPGVGSSAGIAVGKSEAEVRAAYPQARSEPHKYTNGRYLVVDTAPGLRLIFETDGSVVTRYRAGAVPQVDWVEGCG